MSLPLDLRSRYIPRLSWHLQSIFSSRVTFYHQYRVLRMSWASTHGPWAAGSPKWGLVPTMAPMTPDDISNCPMGRCGNRDRMARMRIGHIALVHCSHSLVALLHPLGPFSTTVPLDSSTIVRATDLEQWRRRGHPLPLLAGVTFQCLSNALCATKLSTS